MHVRVIRYLVTAGLLASCSMVGNKSVEPSTKGKQAPNSPAKSAEATSTVTLADEVAAETPQATLTRPPITEEPTEAGSNVINWMMADAAIRTDTPPTAIFFQSIEPIEWPDAALGCPASDRAYAQVVTPGLRVTLSVRGEEYVYHADQQGNFVLCQNGRPFPPVADFAEEWE